MMPLGRGFPLPTWSPLDLITLWLTGEWHQWQATPIPPGANVAPSEWIRVEWRKIAFEPKQTISPILILVFFSKSLSLSFSSLSFSSQCGCVLFLWVLWSMEQVDLGQSETWVKLNEVLSEEHGGMCQSAHRPHFVRAFFGEICKYTLFWLLWNQYYFALLHFHVKPSL